MLPVTPSLQRAQKTNCSRAQAEIVSIPSTSPHLLIYEAIDDMLDTSWGLRAHAQVIRPCAFGRMNKHAQTSQLVAHGDRDKTRTAHLVRIHPAAVTKFAPELPTVDWMASMQDSVRLQALTSNLGRVAQKRTRPQKQTEVTPRVLFPLSKLGRNICPDLAEQACVRCQPSCATKHRYHSREVVTDSAANVSAQHQRVRSRSQRGTCQSQSCHLLGHSNSLLNASVCR